MNARRFEFSFPGNLCAFEQAFTQLRDVLDHADLSPAARYKVELVFEEIVANIVHHGSVPGRDVAVRVALEVGAESIVFTFHDDGEPFDPRVRADPIPAKSLADAPVGGRGLMLVRRAATGFDYCRTPDQHNRLMVTLAAT